MIQIKKRGKEEVSGVVYDISLDGTVVNALGMNVISNTDGFNFQMPNKEVFRYTEEHPYISDGGGRNSEKGKAYVGVDADVCEFEDLYFNHAWNGGINKMGLGVDEYCDATINFARKNYADKLENGKTKKVGNTIKSRKMSGYIEKFLDPSIDLLLNGKGQEFLNNYYSYIEDIYNYRIPLRDIASKGKIKKTLDQYKADCETVTKSGSKKSRQAWYELVIKEGRKVNLDDTIYYINCGSKKSESDVKRVTHQFAKIDGEFVEIDSKIKRKLIEDELKKQGLNEDEVKEKYKTLKTKETKELLKPHIAKEEDEIILNCKLVPNEIIDAEDDILCNDDIEYNVVKYIEQFNSRIKPLLVCFSPEIREDILIKDPKDRKFFTAEQCGLVSGFPNKETDQDTYEQLMTPERKEIEYWLSINEEPPFIKECGIDWKGLVENYLITKQQEESELFKQEDEKYLKALSELTKEDIDEFDENGILPKSISDLVTLDSTMHFKFKALPNLSPSTGGNLFDDISHETVDALNTSEFEYEKFMETCGE